MPRYFFLLQMKSSENPNFDYAFISEIRQIRIVSANWDIWQAHLNKTKEERRRKNGGTFNVFLPCNRSSNSISKNELLDGIIDGYLYSESFRLINNFCDFFLSCDHPIIWILSFCNQYFCLKLGKMRKNKVHNTTPGIFTPTTTMNGFLIKF